MLTKVIGSIFDLIVNMIIGIFKLFFGKKANLVMFALTGIGIYVGLATQDFIIAIIFGIILIILLTRGGK